MDKFHSQTWYLSNLLHKPLFNKYENLPEECVNRDIFYPQRPYFWHLNPKNVIFTHCPLEICTFFTLPYQLYQKLQKIFEITQEISSPWEILPKVKISLHKRCLWCFWQISCLGFCEFLGVSQNHVCHKMSWCNGHIWMVSLLCVSLYASSVEQQCCFYTGICCICVASLEYDSSLCAPAADSFGYMRSYKESNG